MSGLPKGMREIAIHQIDNTEALRSLAPFVLSNYRHYYLGDSLCHESYWAVHFRDGSVHLFQTPHDRRGKYVRAKRRPWNRSWARSDNAPRWPL